MGEQRQQQWRRWHRRRQQFQSFDTFLPAHAFEIVEITAGASCVGASIEAAIHNRSLPTATRYSKKSRYPNIVKRVATHSHSLPGNAIDRCDSDASTDCLLLLLLLLR